MSSWAAIPKKAEESDVPETSVVQDGGATVAVVDTNAIIRGFRLERIADRAVTVEEVLTEVRDKKSREWLERIPFGIEVMDPDEESLKAVIRFARATGDLGFLSAVDVKVIALARMLERNVHGTDHLRDLPKQAKVQKGGKGYAQNLVGWGSVPNPEDWKEIDELNEMEQRERDNLGQQESRILQSLEALTVNAGAVSAEVGEQNEASHSNTPDVPPSTSGTDQCDREGQETPESVSKEAVETKEWEQENGDVNSVSEVPNEGGDWMVAGKKKKLEKKKVEKSAGPEEVDAVDDSDEEEGGFQSSIGCITSDFSMQNVLIQMGLRLVTPDGRRIYRIKKWALRCAGCFTVTKDVSKVFCPKCGNATLDRVEVKVGKDGSEVFGVRTRHSLRGTKYALPNPKGGKKNRDPILSEDVMLARMGKLRQKKEKELDVFAPEYSTDTWFKMAAAKSEIRDLLPNSRKNPNERRGGRRRRK